MPDIPSIPAPNYWTSANGLNYLKGVPDDPDNPPFLTDDQILFSLERSQKARDDWDKVFPGLLPEEQDRLNTIIADNLYRSNKIQPEQTFLDTVQTRDVTAGVHTSGPRGGLGAPNFSIREGQT